LKVHDPTASAQVDLDDVNTLPAVEGYTPVLSPITSTWFVTKMWTNESFLVASLEEGVANRVKFRIDAHLLQERLEPRCHWVKRGDKLPVVETGTTTRILAQVDPGVGAVVDQALRREGYTQQEIGKAYAILEWEPGEGLDGVEVVNMGDDDTGGGDAND